MINTPRAVNESLKNLPRGRRSLWNGSNGKAATGGQGAPEPFLLPETTAVASPRCARGQELRGTAVSGRQRDPQLALAASGRSGSVSASGISGLNRSNDMLGVTGAALADHAACALPSLTLGHL